MIDKQYYYYYTCLHAVNGVFQLRLKSVGLCQQWYSEVSLRIFICKNSLTNNYELFCRALTDLISIVPSSNELLLKRLNVVANVVFQSSIFQTKIYSFVKSHQML